MKSPKLWAYLVGIVTIFGLLFAQPAMPPRRPIRASPRRASTRSGRLGTPGATVYIDRRSWGRSGDAVNATVAAGEYLVILEAEGYQPAQKNVKVARTRKLQESFVPLIKSWTRRASTSAPTPTRTSSTPTCSSTGKPGAEPRCCSPPIRAAT
jgi:hypothetical protein